MKKVAIACMGLIFCLPLPAWSDDDLRSKLFDPPVVRREAPLPQDPESGAKLVCFTYPRFMVKQFVSGSPSGDTAVGIAPIGDAARPPCAPAALPGERRLTEAQMTFEGVKGDFLFMAESDPGGPERFEVFDRRTMRAFYTDRHYGGMTLMADENGALHLRYPRGVRGDCSIIQGGQACWSKITKAEHLPAAIAGLPAPVAACRASYSKKKEAVEDSSILIYDVELKVAPNRPVQVLSRGALDCLPAP